MGDVQETNGCHMHLIVRSFHLTFTHPVLKLMNVTFSIPMDCAAKEKRKTIRSGSALLAKRMKHPYIHPK